MLRIGADLGHGNLVRSERSLDGKSIDHFWPGPSLGRPQNDHGPARPLCEAVPARVCLDRADRVQRAIERLGHALVHRFGLVALDDLGSVSVTLEQRDELLCGNAGQHGRPGDLVAVEVEHGQHRSIAHGVEKLVRMPARRERPGLGFAIAYDDRRDQIGVVEDRAKGVRDGIAELTAFVDRTGRFRRRVARDPAWKRELLEEAAYAGLGAGHARIDLAISALQVGLCDDRWPTVPRSADEDHVEIALLDGAVEMRVDEVKSRGRPPVAEQPRLDLLRQQRFL